MKKNKKKVERDPNDFYETPNWCTERLLEKVSSRLQVGNWLEPCAGAGAIIRTIKNSGITPKFTAVELQDKFKPYLENIIDPTEVFITDYMTWNPKKNIKFDVAIGNPPYKFAQQVIEHSMQHAKQVCMLLRLNFLGSEKRCEWLKKTNPDIFILPNRPSFRGKGTDATEYAWFFWDDKSNGKITILDLTSKLVRSAEKNLPK